MEPIGEQNQRLIKLLKTDLWLRERHTIYESAFDATFTNDKELNK